MQVTRSDLTKFGGSLQVSFGIKTNVKEKNKDKYKGKYKDKDKDRYKGKHKDKDKDKHKDYTRHLES